MTHEQYIAKYGEKKKVCDCGRPGIRRVGSSYECELCMRLNANYHEWCRPSGHGKLPRVHQTLERYDTLGEDWMKTRAAAARRVGPSPF